MKQYFPLERMKGDHPYGEGVYYECTKCGKAVHANLKGNPHCDCYNIRIDGDWGRLSIKDYNFARLFRELPELPVTK